MGGEDSCSSGKEGPAVSVYYNEFDSGAAAWLRELIAAELLPQGHVDERDIREVKPDDLKGFSQHHFFAGIGGWPCACQLAGFDPGRSLFTASAPCQPFSSAGKGQGIRDRRHLWPVLFALVKACRPPTIFGEQVASRLGEE